MLKALSKLVPWQKMFEAALLVAETNTGSETLPENSVTKACPE
jgi:hypothetical protein